MKHWYKNDKDIYMKSNDPQDDWFNDCRILSIYIDKETNEICFREECDSCFIIRKSHTEAVQLLEEAIEWLNKSKGDIL